MASELLLKKCIGILTRAGYSILPPLSVQEREERNDMLREFEQSNRQFPDELFKPSIKMEQYEKNIIKNKMASKAGELVDYCINAAFQALQNDFGVTTGDCSPDSQGRLDQIKTELVAIMVKETFENYTILKEEGLIK